MFRVIQYITNCSRKNMLFKLNILCFCFGAFRSKIKIKFFQFLIVLSRILKHCSNHNLIEINHNLREKINYWTNVFYCMHTKAIKMRLVIWHIASSYIFCNLKNCCQIRKVIVDILDYSFSLFFVTGSLYNVKARFSCVKCEVVSSSGTANIYLFENFLHISCIFSVEYSAALTFSY